MNNITGYLKKSKETKIKFNLKISVYMVKKKSSISYMQKLQEF